MLVVLDTNIVRQDFLMRTGRFQILLDYVVRTGGRFVLPRIVYDELEAVYERELAKRLAEHRRASEALRGIHLDSQPVSFDIDIPAAVGRYMTLVTTRLRIGATEIVEPGPGCLEDVLRRSVRRLRPCSDDGEEIRDAVLWHTVLQIAEQRQDALCLISANVRQFAASGKEELHEQLAAEAAGRGLRVLYAASLSEFNRQHAEPIAFVTKEWLEEQIDADAVLDLVRDDILEAASDAAYAQSSRDEDRSWFRIFGGIEVDDYFVNVLSDGTIRVEVTWWGTPRVEYEVQEFDYSEPASNSYRYGWRRHREVEVRVKVVVEAIIADGSITRWSKLAASIGT